MEGLFVYQDQSVCALRQVAATTVSVQDEQVGVDRKQQDLSGHRHVVLGPG